MRQFLIASVVLLCPSAADAAKHCFASSGVWRCEIVSPAELEPPRPLTRNPSTGDRSSIGSDDEGYIDRDGGGYIGRGGGRGGHRRRHWHHGGAKPDIPINLVPPLRYSGPQWSNSSGRGHRGSRGGRHR
jgi:hypothetical protein